MSCQYKMHVTDRESLTATPTWAAINNNTTPVRFKFRTRIPLYILFAIVCVCVYKSHETATNERLRPGTVRYIYIGISEISSLSVHPRPQKWCFNEMLIIEKYVLCFECRTTRHHEYLSEILSFNRALAYSLTL